MVFDTGSSYQSIKFNRPRPILVVEDLQAPVAVSSPEVLMVFEFWVKLPINQVQQTKANPCRGGSTGSRGCVEP